jgi:YCII-related domain
MPKYIMAYHGGSKFDSPDEGNKHRARFGAWIGGLGDAVVNPGTPLGPAKTVSSSGVSDCGGPNRLTGFSIVKADSLDAAVALARQCPFLEIGTIEVAEAMEMK